MSAYPSWTPASRPGIVPLHPLTFGTILGRSFAALRQNPRVLLGFAMTVQTVATVVVAALVLGITLASFSRLDTIDPTSEDYDTVRIGSFALVAVAGLVLGLASAALGVIVQGVVVTEVSHAVVAEKRRLGELWRQARPAVGRLIGYTFLFAFAAALGIAILAALVIGLGFVALPAAIIVGLLCILGLIPLVLWIQTKLLLVPAVIILEGATIRGAIARSWILVRGRFWPALGVTVLIQLIFGAVAQIVNIPLSLLGSLLGAVIAPTGASDPANTVGLVVSVVAPQALVVLIQAIGLVVQATGATLIYVDCRMRREGLDLDLLEYVERRDAGEPSLGDPYRANVGRAVAPRPAAPGPYAQPGYAPPPGYGYAPQPGYGYAPPPPPAAPPAPPSAPGTGWVAPGQGPADPHERP